MEGKGGEMQGGGARKGRGTAWGRGAETDRHGLLWERKVCRVRGGGMQGAERRACGGFGKRVQARSEALRAQELWTGRKLGQYKPKAAGLPRCRP